MQGFRSHLVAVVLVAAVPGVLLACTKSDSGTPTGASGTASAPAVSSVPPAASSAPTAASAEPAGSTTIAAKDASDAGRATDAAKKSDAGDSPTAVTSASAGPPECGTKHLPDCPLQGWMKSNANPPMMTSNLPGLATTLDKIVTFAPPGYTNWASIAKDGANAARSGDLTAAKAACRTCHDQYKSKYKTEMRTRKI